MTSDELVVIKGRYLAGETTYEIARDYGVKGSSIAYHLKKAGVRLRPKGSKISIVDVWDSYRMVMMGCTTKKVAEEVGIGSGTVSKIVRRFARFPKRPRTRRKILSYPQRKELARRYQEGENYAELGRAFGGISGDVIRSALVEHGIKPRRGWSKYRTVCWTDRKGRKFIFKSTWEKAYAQHLDSQELDWEYETKTFALKKCRCYTPDFVLKEEGSIVHLVEVHGWLDKPTSDRLMEFVKLYPSYSLELVGPGELASMGLVERYYVNHNQAKRVTELKMRLQEAAVSF